jgi:hypothetical protein
VLSFFKSFSLARRTVLYKKEQHKKFFNIPFTGKGSQKPGQGRRLLGRLVTVPKTRATRRPRPP